MNTTTQVDASGAEVPVRVFGDCAHSVVLGCCCVATTEISLGADSTSAHAKSVLGFLGLMEGGAPSLEHMSILTAVGAFAGTGCSELRPNLLFAHRLGVRTLNMRCVHRGVGWVGATQGAEAQE